MKIYIFKPTIVYINKDRLGLNWSSSPDMVEQANHPELLTSPCFIPMALCFNEIFHFLIIGCLCWTRLLLCCGCCGRLQDHVLMLMVHFVMTQDISNKTWDRPSPGRMQSTTDYTGSSDLLLLSMYHVLRFRWKMICLMNYELIIFSIHSPYSHQRHIFHFNK